MPTKILVRVYPESLRESSSPSFVARSANGIEAALKTFMTFRAKSRKILIPDVSPVVETTTRQGMIVAGIGVFCMSVVIAAVLFVFLGA